MPDPTGFLFLLGLRSVRCWLLVVGCWLSVVGCWLLVVGLSIHKYG